MRLDELSDEIYDLVEVMLTGQSDLAVVPVIESHDNAPRPLDCIYLVFDPCSMVHGFGNSSFKEATDTESSSRTQEYVVSVTLRQVKGYGEYLQLIRQRVDDIDIRTHLYNRRISIMKVENVVQIPRLLDDDRWERESVMEMIIAITHVTSDATSFIETVEIINNIGD